MKLGLLGGGTIARLVLEHLKQGEITGVEVVEIAGRSAGSQGAELAREFSVPYVVGGQALRAAKPQVVMEAASHDALLEHLVSLLESGISVGVLSAGCVSEANV